MNDKDSTRASVGNAFIAGLASPSGAMAVLWAAASSAMLGCLWVIMRIQSETLHPLEVSFFATFFGLLVFLPSTLRGGRRVWRTRRHGTHFIRAVFNGIGILMWFTAITMMPLADAAGLNLLMPLVTILAAMVFLSESVGPRRWAALVVGIMGAVVIVRPGLQEVEPGVLLVLGSVCCGAGQRVIAKSLTKTESSSTSVLYLMLFMTPVTLIAALAVWTTPTLTHLAWLVGAGCLLAGAHFTFVHSISLADVSALEPVNFTRLVWAALFGFIFFDEIPDIWVFVGGALIIGATSYIAHRESVLKRRTLKGSLTPESGV